MKYTMKVYKNSPDYQTFLRARFNKEFSGQSFEWVGHRWAYEHTSFDDDGDYDLLYRFDDKPHPEVDSASVSADDMTIRDYMAAKAMNGMCSHVDTWGMTVPQIAKRAYDLADEMLRAREAS